MFWRNFKPGFGFKYFILNSKTWFEIENIFGLNPFTAA
jgi:hypothetical protein